MRLGEQRFVAGDAGLGLLQVGVEICRIEMQQDIARLDVLPLGEEDASNLSIDPRLQGDKSLVGFGPSHELQGDRHVLQHCPGCRDRHGRRRRFLSDLFSAQATRIRHSTSGSAERTTFKARCSQVRRALQPFRGGARGEFRSHSAITSAARGRVL